MKKWKQRLAAFLMAAMLASLLPAAALAEETPAEELPAETAPTEELPADETPTEELPAEEAPGEDATDSSPIDEVVFNLGNMEVTVGMDEEKAGTGETPYDLFDEDGNYTLELEPDAFFPYEVQFTYDGETWEEWFMAPDDTVMVGGHTFSVETYVSDPNTLTQIGIWVGDEYVPAYPEEKEFTNDGPSVMLTSAGLPLAKEKKNVSLDLSTAYLPSQLTAVRVSAVLSGLTPEQSVQATDRVAWVRGNSSYNIGDDFEILDQTGFMDLSSNNVWNHRLYLELIVGTALQLDIDNNTLYQVNVTLPASGMFQWDVTSEAESVLSDAYQSSQNKWFLNLKPMAANAAGLILRMDFSEEYADSERNVQIYKGYYESQDELAQAGAEEVTDQIWGADAAGIPVTVNRLVNLTAVIGDRDGDVASVLPMEVHLYISSAWVYAVLYSADPPYEVVTDDKDTYVENGVDVFTFGLDESKPLNGTYAVMLTYDSDEETEGDYVGYSHIEKAVQGLYGSLKAAAGRPDLKEQLFKGDADTGKFTADFSNGVNFTVFDKYGEVHQLVVKTVSKQPEPAPSASTEKNPLSEDTYFRATGIDEAGDAYVMPYQHDSYYSNGYQTIFTTDQDLDLTRAKLEFYAPSSYDEDGQTYRATVYAGKDTTSGEPQKSGITENNFADGPVQYSAAAQDGVHLKNYWVTIVKQDLAAVNGKLFVNGINGPRGTTRTVFLTEAYGNHHDIFLANVGAGDLTNLKVELTDAQNVKLDDFWTIGGDGNNTLAPLSFNYREADDGIAKIRLLPDGEGVVSGTLTISADGQEPVVITLTGIAFTPEITTGSLPHGVKYVPYGQLVMTNNEYEWLQTTFTLVSGQLPAGIELRANGEIYGTPRNSGSYEFNVKADYEVVGAFASDYNYTGDVISADTSDYGTHLYLNILDNTGANVESQTDIHYELLDRVPDMRSYQAQLFRSNGEYGNFVDFWLDGVKLTEGQDYDSEEGSTKITIRAQTFQNAGTGTHTIAAEFRDGGNTNLNSTLKRTAQNYTVSSGTSSNGPSGGSSKPAVKPSVDPAETPKTIADIFRDITVQDWFYPDADWAYQNKLMIGVTSNLYKPYNLISPATVVTVLARLEGVDLSQYAGTVYEEIAAGQWYTNAAVWAKETGLLPEGPFSAQPPIARAAFAVMLVKYLEHKGIDCSLPENPVAFADADMMTQEEQDAFQVLYSLGIFKGTGNYYMDPTGSTTRAQLAVLLHRLSVFVDSQK